jgi:hypothetical protein
MFDPGEDGRGASPKFPSKMDVIAQALKELEGLLVNLDNAGFSIASIHVNSAIESLKQLRAEVDSHSKS